MNFDLINACFEYCSACFLTLNVIQLYKDKIIKGISMWPVWCYTIWGIMNIPYYGSVGSSKSQIAAIFVTLVNLIWVSMAFYYRRKNNELFRSTIGIQ